METTDYYVVQMYVPGEDDWVTLSSYYRGRGIIAFRSSERLNLQQATIRQEQLSREHKSFTFRISGQSE
ncbi:hypothetical protein DYBT9623_05151 [Dyadobacter sp. CECT 9623]|uniref:Uncharacterized protein n=1 Tax=Dyadobacter linearis TaxID=2823330 RepID=A0ABM8UXS9_9BACT|nr:hypothetical protein DYBT9623_05151 [Dyadobacter sp. CECT 9623]